MVENRAAGEGHGKYEAGAIEARLDSAVVGLFWLLRYHLSKPDNKHASLALQLT